MPSTNPEKKSLLEYVGVPFLELSDVPSLSCLTSRRCALTFLLLWSAGETTFWALLCTLPESGCIECAAAVGGMGGTGRHSVPSDGL